MISILMPVKNAGPYLEDCLTSIVNQSYTDWELIAVNDHSDDNSVVILEAFAGRDDRIQWVNHSGHGIIEALRTAYAHSTGNRITRMDADDLMSTDKLDQMAALLGQSGAGHLVTGYVEYFSSTGIGDGYAKYAKWLNDLSEQENNFVEIYKECVIPSPCWMIARDDFERCGGFLNNLYPEDYDLCFRFREAGLRIRTVKKVIHHWRDHSSRASRNDPNYLDNRFLELKLYYFLKADYNSSKELVLWGAGKKAKLIAQYLLDKGIRFRWICNNDKKIGKTIYDQMIESTDIIRELNSADCIVAVANHEAQLEIKATLADQQPIKAYFMC